ncbi:hypothetical protein HDV00_007534 [Rhizophlyctis rosea]|nr:hypothetical protein HDV00_007534 [Rhizophlyctis rosea]
MEPLLQASLPQDVKLVEHVRVFLQRQKAMNQADVFLTKDGYPFPKAEEKSTEWAKILTKDGTIDVFKKPEPATNQPLEVPKLPEDPKFWSSNVGDKPPNPQFDDNVEKATPSAVYARNASDLGWDEWLYLLKVNSLLKGTVLSNENGPAPGWHPVIAPPSDIYFDTYDKADVEVITVYSEHAYKCVRQGYTKVTSSMAIPYVSATVTASHQEMTANSTNEKEIWSTAQYQFPRAIVRFGNNLRPSEGFQQAIQDALDRNSTAEDKRAALTRVLDTYGHVFATEIQLGGLLVTSKHTTIKTKEEQTRVENSLGESVQVTYDGMSLGAGFQTGDMEEITRTDQEAKKRITFSATGGNTLMVTNTAEWFPTVGDYRNWRVMRVSKQMLTYDLLDAALSKEVKRLAPATKPLEGRWVPCVTHFTDRGSGAHRDLAVYRPQDIPDGWFWLGQTYDNNRCLIVREAMQEAGVFNEIVDYRKIWDDHGSGKDMCYNLWDPVPGRSNEYVSLGSFFMGNVYGDQRPPASDPKLRAVRKDLVIEAHVANDQFWDDAGTHAKDDGSVYAIRSRDANTGVELGMFKAFNGRRTPDAVAYVLRKDAINIIE